MLCVFVTSIIINLKAQHRRKLLLLLLGQYMVKQPENADLDYAKKSLEEIEKGSNSLVKKPKKELEFEINLSIIGNKVPAEEPNL
jgi:hypothetical protein